MGIHSQNDEIPVEIINRNLLFNKRNLYYNKEREEKAKKEREEKAKKEREEKAKKAREEKAKKDREEKAKKAREEKAKKDREKNKNKNKDKVGDDDNNNDNNNNDNNNNNNNNNDNNDNNDGNNGNNGNGGNDGNVPPPNQTGAPELTNTPTNPNQMTPAATFAPTNTYMSNASSLPSEDGRQKLSIAGISVISMILVGVIVLIILAVYRRRNSMRRGAVRLYDEPGQNDSSVIPRYLSMRSLRIPSMPPKVQLTRLSSATILLPYRENNPSPLNNNTNNPAPSFNNLNNNYLSPYTKVHNLSSPNSSSSGSLSVNVNNNLEQNSQKTDSVQSYSSLESSFPIPPQRAVNDNYNTTPTSATFGDMYKLKK
ncbi:uncharacterized protein OCT59_006421 [Rhizophagus irregularis]|uniref:uncharacterized protein n=1 Tax=Rhizophagus irregularis TaxID=588596 RepID=UPI00331884E4|nr:hypothetical protein OCT59_006421 [Rhizophagus irregularis]